MGGYPSIKLQTPIRSSKTSIRSSYGGGSGKYKSIQLIQPIVSARGDTSGMPQHPAVTCGPKRPILDARRIMLDAQTATFMLKGAVQEWGMKMAKRMEADAKYANPSTRISVQASGLGNQVVVRATGKSAATLSFDQIIEVPPGGFKPPPGKFAWAIQKEGTIRWRTRIYKKYGGQTILRRGFLHLSWDNNVNFKNFQNLTTGATSATTLQVLGSLTGALMRMGMRVSAYFKPAVQLH